MTQCVMGIDIGSYESKGVLTDTDGHVLATADAHVKLRNKCRCNYPCFDCSST